MEGELMIPFRRGFQKVYDLRERVLPDWVDTSTPDSSEFARYLIDSHLQAHGFGTAKEIAYLRKGMGAKVKQALQELAEAGEVMPIMVSDSLYYCQPDLLELADQPLPRAGVRILSPFDNAITQRRRTLELFDFDYQIECYVPEPKRRYGYFALPLLYRDQLVGRMDCKAHRDQRRLALQSVHLQCPTADTQPVCEALAAALPDFVKFQGCDTISCDNVSPRAARKTLQNAIAKYF